MLTMKTMLLAAVLVLVGCGSDPAQGAQGEQGPAGVVGAVGVKGEPGAPGSAGKDGAPGKDGAATTVDGSRIKARYLVAEDGARELLGWRDTMLDTDCSFMVASDGATRCLPGTKYVGNQAAVFYSDDACAVPVALWINAPPCAPPTPKYGVITDTDACVSTSRVYELGAGMASPLPSMFRALEGQGCIAYPPIGSIYQYTAPLAPTGFVAASAK